MIYALTVKQPWAWLIVKGHKDVECRSWPPPDRLIGQRIAIHAGQGYVKGASDAVADYFGVLVPPREFLVFGAVIGSAIIDRVVNRSSMPWHFKGSIGWVLRDAELCRPIPMAGRLGLWRLP